MRATLYTWTFCPFCIRAKRILHEHGISFEEHVMDDRHAELLEQKQKYGHPTVPIIILDGEFIGGCDELEVLQSRGLLKTA